jgi:putative hemolysin
MKIERKKGIEKIKVHHNKTLFFCIIVLFCLLIFVLIMLVKTSNKNTNIANQTSIANPASVYCIEQGGNLDIRADFNGGEKGICVFNDGSECDEWAFFRKECNKSSFYSNLSLDCANDNDCVPASCCHANSCVKKENSPVCSGIACTLSCEPKTLDCGQGSCVCVNSKCSAIIT